MSQENESQPATGELEGRYANYFKSGTMPSNSCSTSANSMLRARWALSYQDHHQSDYAKALLGLLRESVAQYEQTFGSSMEMKHSLC